MRLRIALVLVAFVALVSFQPGGAKAAVIPIVNGDFQDTLTLTLGSSATLGNYELSAVGWTITGTGGTFQPTIGPAKPYTSGTPNNRVGFLNGSVVSPSQMEQTLSDNFSAGLDYLLTFDVGHRRDVGFPSLATAVIFDATTDTNLITLTLLDPGNDSFSTQSLLLSSSLASSVAGNQIGIRFTSNGSQLNLDNVSLSALPVPSALLLFVSGFGILGWAAGRHKHQANA